MRKIALLIAALMVICCAGIAEEVPERYLEVVLNRYEPAPWNHEYGHYDFTLRVAPEYTENAEINFRVDGCDYGGEEITFTYGPEDGNNSAGIVEVYTAEKHHEPVEELVILEGITDADFVVFMDLFQEDFAEYDSQDEDLVIFRVKDIMFDVYSVEEYQNCAKAMMQLVGMFPGGMGHMMRNYPDKYNELTRVSNQN